MKNLIASLLILASVRAASQEMVFGDTAMIRSIQTKCSTIYDRKDSTTFLLTRVLFSDEATGGTNLSVDSYKKKISRIVAFTTTSKGLLGVEFYYWGSSIIMIYETMEYFEEDSPKGQIRNFRNIPYWESRFYFANNKLVGHKHTGRMGIGSNYQALKEIGNAKKVFEFVREHTSLN